MLYIGKKEVESVYHGSTVVTAIYKGALLVWEAIKSCFGAGYWKNDSSWSNTEGWEN